MAGMSLERAREFLERLGDTGGLPNFIDQADARFVLFAVGESRENFPAFSPRLDRALGFGAYGYLSAACALAESGQRTEAVRPLTLGATILEHVHGPRQNRDTASPFHLLVCSLAFYAAGQYSRAYVALRDTEPETTSAYLISAFLRKDFVTLLAGINHVLLGDEHSDQAIALAYSGSGESSVGADDLVIEVLTARSLALALEFIYSGQGQWLDRAYETLSDAMSLAQESDYPPAWWSMRLLRLIIRGLQESSPWEVLPPFFPTDDQSRLRDFIRVLSQQRRPITELWVAQRAVLPKVMDTTGHGAVVSMPTSSGKTRIAEIASLQTLILGDRKKVLYLAPFRSLAIEIENAFATSLGRMGFGVSHLYGGARFGSADRMLAQEADVTSADDEDLLAWIDVAFRSSLALILAREEDAEAREDDVLEFLRSRFRGVLADVGNDRGRWRRLVSTGLPLRASRGLEDEVPILKQVISSYIETERALDDLDVLVRAFDDSMQRLPSDDFQTDYPLDELDPIRRAWLGGTPIRYITQIHTDALDICTQHYAYRLTWMVNGVSRLLHLSGDIEEAEALESTGVLIELGLPTVLAAKVFLAGIRSRTVALELSGAIAFEDDDPTIGVVADALLGASLDDGLRMSISPDAIIWLDSLSRSRRVRPGAPPLPDFILPDATMESNSANVRGFEGHLFLASPDYRETIQLESTTELPFERVADDPRVGFAQDTASKTWRMVSRLPASRRRG